MTENRADRIALGAWFKVKGLEPDTEEVFYLVAEHEADYLENRIPPSSPLARALTGKKPGDTVPFKAPLGSVELTVLEVGRC